MKWRADLEQYRLELPPRRELGRSVNGGGVPRDDNLARRVEVCGSNDFVRGRGFGAQVTNSGVFPAHDGRHGALALGDGLLHGLAAESDQADRVREVERPAATSALYSPSEWPAANAGNGSSGRASLRRRQCRDAHGEDRRLGVRREGQLFDRALETQPGERRAERRVRSREDPSRAAAEASARALPIPTACVP